MTRAAIHNIYVEPHRAGSLLRLLTGFVLGAGASFAMAPWNFWWALGIALSALYGLLLSAPGKTQSFATGWGFGFGYFVFGLSWIGNALLVEGNEFAWAWPLAVCGLPFMLAFYTGAATLFSHMFFNLRHWTGFIGFIALMCLFEWLRGNLFTGFPWNLYGYTWSKTLPVIQILSISNVYYLTFLTMLWLMAPVFIYTQVKSGASVLSTAIIGPLALGSLLGCLAFGLLRLETSTTFMDNSVVKIVQPNIEQGEKWDREKLYAHFQGLIETSMQKPQDAVADKKFTYIVWPETSLNYWVMQDKNARYELTNLMRSYNDGAALLTGYLHHNPVDQSYSNSLVMFDRDGQPRNMYNKSHLVPFGEYIPFQKWIPLKTVTKFSGFKKGNGPDVQPVSTGYAYIPLICYEIIFPGVVKPEMGGDFIVNVTNDAWYGESAGPYQHYEMAQFRALETGFPVIRAANTGISGIFDPFGRNITQSSLYENKVLISSIPQKEPLYLPAWTRKPFVFPFFLMLVLGLALWRRRTA